MSHSTRRDFLREVSAASLLTLGLTPARLPRPWRRAPIRVRGRVTAAGRPLAGAGVSDGRTVVRTDRGGAYELVSDAGQRWLHLSLPAGHEIPRQASGTAQLFRPLTPDARGELRADWALTPLAGGDAAHAFFLAADPQTQNRYETDLLHAETVPALRRALAGLGGVPAFGIACGDIMFDDLSLYPEYERAVRAVDLPFFQVVGNHDMDYAARTDEASTATFERHFGPAWYSFNRGEVHYVVLDDVLWHGDGYIGYLSAPQLEWLAADLALVEPGRTVVVALHIPLASSLPARSGDAEGRHTSMVNNREALYRLLEPYRAHVLSGHTHEHEHLFEGGVHEHVHGTACGAWWSGPICYDGTPDGFGVYEVRGSELRWRYQPSTATTGEAMRLYRRGADPAAPDEVVANLWDWDPAWTVVWYEDGQPRGRMARRTGLDPLSVELHRGPELPARRKWVEPVPTAHLFYATPGAGATECRVEATDRWGQVCTERLALR